MRSTLKLSLFLLFTIVITCAYGWDPIDIRTLPLANSQDKVNVVYLQAPLLKWKFGDILADFHLFHTAVAFHNLNSGDQWTIEYDAVPSMFGTVLPQIVNDTLVWQNTGAAIVYHSINSTYWSSTNKVVSQIDGSTYNTVLKWLYSANQTHPYYNMFNVLNHWNTDKSTYYLTSTTCADFQFGVFDVLAYLGAKFTGPTLKKDDINLYTSEAPELVSFEKGSKHHDRIMAFYELLTVKLAKLDTLPILQIIEEVLTLVRGDIYLHHNNDYYLLKLHWPNMDWKYYERPIQPVKPL